MPNKIPDFYEFFENVPAGRVLADAGGKIILTNKLARRVLGKKDSSRWQNLKALIRMVGRYKNEIVKDYPDTGRIIRFEGHYIDLTPRRRYVFVLLADVTEDWAGERQKDILEFIASTAAQILPTAQWVNSVLKRIVVMMEVKSASIMLYNQRAKTLETAFSSTAIKNKPLKLKLNQGLAGISAKQKLSLALYNGLDKAHQALIKNPVGPSSYLAVPMFVGNKLVGVLNIRDRADKFFREQDRAFYEVVANRVAIALEYRQLVERLKEDYERLTTVITHTLHGKALLNDKKEVLIANPALAELLETEPDKLTGKRIDQLVPELADLLARGDRKIETEIELNSLESKPCVGIGLAKIKRHDGENTVVTLRDITAEKQLEKTKDDFIATATHELRTPLTAILGYLSMMKNRPLNLDHKQQIYFGRIERASNTLFKLVEDLLSVLRIEQEDAKPQPEKLKLLPIIKEIARALETKTASKKIKITLPRNSFSVLCDVNALQKVLLNLLDNAVKYSHKGGRVRVSFKELKSNRKKIIKVSIHDSGVGIPKRQQKRLFEKFERVHNELSIEAGGTGLGLYITKKLIEQWGGTIKIKSSVGKGSTFSFTVPAK